MTAWLGLLRSLLIYRRPGRQAGLRRMYRPYLGNGDLAFDIGAHVGDRTHAFAALGARVVALEPQPLMARWLAWRYRGAPRITLLAQAAGAAPGEAELAISRSNPTVSTLSRAWRQRVAEHNDGFRSVRWDSTVRVPVTTLDALIERFGAPRFCKIDVEGHEAEVLRGLSRPVPALSVEFVAGTLEVAIECVQRLQQLGRYEFNAVAGERRAPHFDRWRTAEQIIDWLGTGAEGIASGDLYARRVPSPAPAPATE